jgi:hypothetical protein
MALPRRTQALIGGGVLVGIVLLVVLLGGVGDETSVPVPSAAARESVGEGPLVPPVDPCDLLTIDEIDVALGLLEIPVSQRNIITSSGGEACTWVNDRDGGVVEGLSIQIEPGAFEDFDPEGQLDGVSGESADGVGRAAVWFAGEREGTLSVVAESSHGYLLVRVTVARLDLEADAILPVARDVALAVLPRFPGMGAEPGEPVTTVIEPEPVEVPPSTWLDNLLAREEDGDWTLGEGLVGTLRVFAGELDAEEVLLDPDALVDDSGTAIVSLARAYLEDGPDAAAQAEISRVLDLLFFTREEMEAVAEPAATRPTFELAMARQQTGPGSTLRAGGPCGDDPGPCLVEFRPAEVTSLDSRYGAGKYRMYHYSNAAEAGWDLTDFFIAANAMQRSAFTFEPLAEDFGGMPQVTFLFTQSGSPGVTSDTEGACSIHIRPPMQQAQEAVFKQLIAHHMAFCLFSVVLPDHGIRTNGSGLWWTDALAWHLSNSAYKAPECLTGRCDLEWAFAPPLSARELGSDLFQRTASNAMFFQHLWNEVGRDDSQVLQLPRRLAPGGSGDADAVASYPDMARIFHEFAKQATDASVRDSGGGSVPYQPDATAVSVSSAPHHVLFDLERFWTERARVEIPEGQKACVEYAPAGTSMMSWRPGREGPGDAGGWSQALPPTIEGDFVVVVTTTQAGESPTLTVTKLIPADESDCEPEPTPSGDFCMPVICSPSDFYKSVTNAPSWFIDILE